MKKFLVIIVLIVSTFSIGQTAYSDSLKKIWNNEELDLEKRVDALHNMSWYGYLATTPDSALYFGDIEFKLGKEHDNNYWKAAGTMMMAFAWEFKGDIKKALPLHEQSLHYYQQAKDTAGIANCLSNIGVKHYYLGDFQKALKYYLRSLDKQRQVGNKSLEANVLNNIGGAYLKIGEHKLAEKYMQEGYELRIIMKDDGGISNSLHNLGYVNVLNGDYKKGIDSYEEALKISRRLGDVIMEGTTLNNIGQTYQDYGNYSTALNYFKQGLKIKIETKDMAGIAEYYLSIGNNYFFKRDFDSSSFYYQKCFHLYDSLENNYSSTWPLTGLGNIELEKGNYDEALTYYNRVALKMKELEDAQGEIDINNNLASLYLNKKDFEKSKEFSQEAIKKADQVGYREGKTLASEMLFKNHFFQKNFDKAELYLKGLIESVNSELKNNYFVLPENEKELFYQKLDEKYDLFNGFAVLRSGQNPQIAGEVFNNILFNKGLSLRSTSSIRNTIKKSGDSLLINKYFNWIGLKDNIVQQKTAGNDTKELEEYALEVEKELIKSSLAFENYNTALSKTWKDVQKQLKPEESIIEFITYKDIRTEQVGYAAILLNQKSEYPELIELCLKSQLEAVINVQGYNDLKRVNELYENHQSGLYELIWKPFQKKVSKDKKIYISPTGLLHKLSFAAIKVNKKQRLSDLFQLELKLNSGEVSKIESPLDQGNLDGLNGLIYGGIDYDGKNTKETIWTYLNGTKKETKQIDSIFKTFNIKVQTFQNDLATESSFKKNSFGAKIIHIATHGFFYQDPAKSKFEIDESEGKDIQFRSGNKLSRGYFFSTSPNPMNRSGLVFAKANEIWSNEAELDQEDGVLTASEVSNLDLNETELLVLSACESGLGDIKGNEGVYGLQRAFKLAGVKQIIMSLWQVPDKETMEFMTIFYAKFMEEKDVKRAFNFAQNEMKSKYSAFYWGAFVLLN